MIARIYSDNPEVNPRTYRVPNKLITCNQYLDCYYIAINAHMCNGETARVAKESWDLVNDEPRLDTFGIAVHDGTIFHVSDDNNIESSVGFLNNTL